MGAGSRRGGSGRSGGCASYTHDGTHKLRDAYDKRNYFDGRVALIDIDVPDREADADVIPGFAEAMAMNPTRKMNSAIDLGVWLEKLSARDRKMLELRAAGHTWEETGAAVGIPLRSAYGRCQKLGRELASWGANENGGTSPMTRAVEPHSRA